MKVLGVVCLKGGSGKTTMATQLAVLAKEAGHSVALVDLDPQASATVWADARSGGEGERRLTVTPAQVPRLGRILDDLRRRGVELAILDTAPHAASMAEAGAEAADLVLVPTRPSQLDISALPDTLRVVRDRDAWVVLSAVPTGRSTIGREAETALAEEGVRIVPHRLGNRLAFVRPLSQGRSAAEWEPRGKAAAEAGALWEWARARLRLRPRRAAGAPPATVGLHPRSTPLVAGRPVAAGRSPQSARGSTSGGSTWATGGR